MYATVMVALLLTEEARVRTTVDVVPEAITEEIVAGFPSTSTAKSLAAAVVALIVSL